MVITDVVAKGGFFHHSCFLRDAGTGGVQDVALPLKALPGPFGEAPLEHGG